MNNEMLNSAQQRVKQFRTELGHLGSPEVVASLISEIRAWDESTLAMIATSKDQVESDYATEYARWNGVAPPSKTPVEDSHWGWTLIAGGLGAGLLECCFAGILGGLTFNMALGPAVATGVLVTVLLMFVFKGVWSALTPEDGRPRKTARTLSQQLLVVFPLWAAAIVFALLLGRSLTAESEFANTIFNSLMTLLSLLSPALAAILFRFGELKNWARVHVKQYRGLEKLEGEVKELDAYCDSVEARLPAGRTKKLAPQDPPVSGSGLAAAAALIVLIAGSADLRASDCLNQIWIDKSSSPSAVQMESAMGRALELIPSVAQADCGLVWEFYGFASNAASATPFYTVRLPERPVDSCPAQARAGEMGVLFRAVALAQEKKRRLACDDARKRANDAYQAEIARQLNEARAKSAHLSAPDDSDRTCIVDLLSRVRTTRGSVGRVLILTDGEETCVLSPGLIEGPTANRMVVMAIVAKQTQRRYESPGQYYTRVADGWLKLAPWLSVTAPYGITPAIFGSASSSSSGGARLTEPPPAGR
jgi:hypothetical protein